MKCLFSDDQAFGVDQGLDLPAVGAVGGEPKGPGAGQHWAGVFQDSVEAGRWVAIFAGLEVGGRGLADFEVEAAHLLVVGGAVEGGFVEICVDDPVAAAAELEQALVRPGAVAGLGLGDLAELVAEDLGVEGEAARGELQSVEVFDQGLFHFAGCHQYRPTVRNPAAVVGVELAVAASGVVGGQGLAAGLAAQEPAKRELVALADVRHLGSPPRQAIADAGEEVGRDDRLVGAVDLEAVLYGADSTGIERVDQQVAKFLHAQRPALLRDQAAPGGGGERVGDALAARDGLEGGSDERALLRVGLDPLAGAVVVLPVQVADRRRVRPAALALPRQHAVADLLAVQLDDELVRGTEEVLDAAADRTLGDREEHAVEPGAHGGELVFERPLLAEVAEEARHVVHDEDVDLPAGLDLGGDERQRLGERRALRGAPALPLLAEAAHQVDLLPREPLDPVSNLLVEARARDLRGVGDPGVVDAAESHKRSGTVVEIGFSQEKVVTTEHRGQGFKT